MTKTDRETSVAVIDDDKSVREALEALLQSVDVPVRLFPSVNDFLPHIGCNDVGCLVLDVRLPGKSGLEFQDDLVRANIDIPVIFISGHADVPMSVRAMKAGAIEFLTKPLKPQDLLDAVQVAFARRRARDEQSELASGITANYATLSAREKQVMELVIAGFLNKQIANTLKLSEGTIKLHRARVMHKMQVRSLPELVRVSERFLRPTKSEN
jgi:FixJ family two-component response regulator